MSPAVYGYAFVARVRISMDGGVKSRIARYTSMHWRLVVDWPPRYRLDSIQQFDIHDLLEEEDVWFWLMDFVVLPA